MLETTVCIIGAGPGGAAAALFLDKLGIECVVLDKSKFPRDKICGDALSGKVVEILKKIDPSWISDFHQKESFLGSWGVKFVAPNGQALSVPFKSDYNPEDPAPGYISRRVDFDHYLVEKLHQAERIELREGFEVKSYQKENKHWIIEGRDANQTIKANMLIVADGANSGFVRQTQSLTVTPKENCFGLRAYYDGVTELDDHNFIELHFTQQFLPGYFWIFPLPGGRANVGVGMRSDKMKEKSVHLKKSFQKIIEEDPLIAPRFENAQLEGGIKQFSLPLGSSKRKISGDGYVLVGDAGALIDPFTGEGIGNALISGMYAAEIAKSAIEQGDYSASILSKYDDAVYKRLWSELNLSRRMQELVNFPWLFNFVVNKANKNETLRETISCMFEDLDMRSRLKDPKFYFKLLFSN